jgi:hypothetical protein
MPSPKWTSTLVPSSLDQPGIRAGLFDLLKKISAISAYLDEFYLDGVLTADQVDTLVLRAGQIFLNGQDLSLWLDQDVRTTASPTFDQLTLTETVNPPLVVSSTAKVVNFNADLLDGKDSARYLTSNAQGGQSSNLDALTTNGFYYTSSTATPRPAGSATGAVLVSDMASDRKMQVFFSLLDGQSWVRYMNGGVWSSWNKNWSEANMPLDSGTYTPTLFNTTNVQASTASVCQYMRLGNVVTVSGAVTVDTTTASVNTVLGMSLPIASTFTQLNQCGGTATSAVVTGSFAILADVTNNRATFQTVNIASTANNAWRFSFTYQIL